MSSFRRPSRVGAARCARALCTALAALALAAAARGQATLYWDRNGSSLGAGSAPAGTWSTSAASWATNFLGTSASVGWTAGSNAFFSAGLDASSAYTVTVSGTQSLAGLTVLLGAPTLTGGTLNFGAADATVSVVSGTLTLASGLAGSGSLAKTGGGTLVVTGADKAYTGDLSVSAGTLELASNQTFGALTLAGGTLRLRDAAVSLSSLSVTGDSTIDFAGASASLSVLDFAVAAGVKLTVLNWTEANDPFIAANWTGATLGQRTGAPVDRVDFTGYGAGGFWAGWDSGVRPASVPEPRAAAVLALASALLFVARRRRRDPGSRI
jgi:autotransporter-associated beta strand protein